MNSRSVSFDRAAGFYDQTRDLPPELAQAQTELLCEELAATTRCLEIGVGTGRIALPLAGAGIHVAGVDLSPAMLGRLRAKGGGAVPVAVADARRLPFGAAAFDAVLACHVLHLVQAWADVADEALRVLRPGGTFLVSQGGQSGDETALELRKRLRQAAGLADVAGRVGLHGMDELDRHVAARGVGVRHLPTLRNTQTRSVAEFLDQVAQQYYSWTWDLDEATVRQAAAEVRVWAEHRWGDLTVAQMGAGSLRWHAYDVPA
ncbi:MAG TPA: class I SAM-dependent methyltransferase [Sporichthyaceae bacterium]|jgi:SAM-dependent methyltransferase|nr:class I SAM-dependent methyltransferase [Sporichthyaceae bacterium]